MTSLSDKVCNQTTFHVSISLANDLTAIAYRKGKRTITWSGQKRKTKVGLPVPLLLKLLYNSLLPASTLIRKVISVFLAPENKILIDIVDIYSIIGMAAQNNVTSTRMPTFWSRVLRVTLMISSKH